MPRTALAGLRRAVAGHPCACRPGGPALGRTPTATGPRRVKLVALAGLSHQAVAKTLNERGIKTAAGKSWTPVQVTRVRGRLGLTAAQPPDLFLRHLIVERDRAVAEVPDFDHDRCGRDLFA
jgi:hypothetical protein